MPPKRPSSSKASSVEAKPGKSERNKSEDFSLSIKKKLSASTRTGQACDRCKVRKIRCDGRTGGCSPCLQANTECRTTDRITGRATTRGHTETLESENRSLRVVISTLQEQLKDLGVEAKAVEGLAAQRPLPNDPDPHYQAASSTAPPSQGNSADIKSSIRRPLPKFRAENNGDNYLGVSYGSGHLTSIHGTALSLFGMEVDLADLVPDDENAYLSSYEYVVDQMVARQPPDPSDCALPPTFEECENYASWYFRAPLSFFPILDRRAFMHLLVRIYHYSQWAELNTAERVMVQMMLATVKFQTAQRTSNRDWIEQSHGHFKYAMSCFFDLMRSHQLEDIQAMALICFHLRSFPRPGAAWIMTNQVFALTIELGLHRSAQAWSDTTEKDPMALELRKRTFWSIHALQVLLAGKLGRPMPIRVDDIDIEFPEPVDDSLPSETNLSDFNKCSFRVGIQFLKLQVLFNRMYSTIYAVRMTPQRYEQNIKKLEEDIRQWEAQIPHELHLENAADNDRVAAFYLRFWNLEFHLLAHHPALCRSRTPDIWRSNLESCKTAATKMLLVVQGLEKANSADLVWTNCTVYLAALFVLLFAALQDAEQMTPNDFRSLRDDVEAWCSVIAKAGSQLGSGDEISVTVRRITDSAIGKIGDKLANIQAERARKASEEASEPRDVKPPPEVFFHLPPSIPDTFPEPPSSQNSVDPTGPYCERPMSGMEQSLPQSDYTPGDPPVQSTPHQMPHSATPFDQSAYPAAFHIGTFVTLGRGPDMPRDYHMSGNPSSSFQPSPGPPPANTGSNFIMDSMNTSLNVNMSNHGASNMQSNTGQNQWPNWPTSVNVPHQPAQNFPAPTIMSSQPNIEANHIGAIGHGPQMDQQQPHWPEIFSFGNSMPMSGNNMGQSHMQNSHV